jgi:hypothetical protein
MKAPGHELEQLALHDLEARIAAGLVDGWCWICAW